MEFRIADTFTDSLARLTRDEQKAVKTTAFDLQLNPASPGFSFHKLDKAKDKNFWSVRVSADIRLIVHRSVASLLLCYVDHHDKAYAWAERRKLEVHPKTGAAQLVEIRETVKEIVVPVYVQAERRANRVHAAPKAIFSLVSDDELLNYGVPPEWLGDVRNATEDTLLGLTDHLPAEASEALLELATGGKPRPPAGSLSSFLVSSAHSESVAPTALVRAGHEATSDSFEHPDAQRRFHKIETSEELQRALEYPWDKWTIFLHPDQREWVEKNFSGPAKVAGSAGTGKTIVAVHRVVHLARINPASRVLLTTFSDSLANALKTMLRRLLSGEPRLGERIDVYSLHSIGHRLYKAHIGQPALASPKVIRELIQEAASSAPAHRFSLRFLQSEWDQVVDPWQLNSWEAYRDVARLGRKTRVSEAQRKLLWSIFDHVRAALLIRKLITEGQLFTSLATAVKSANKIIYDHVVVDEAQDLDVPQLRFLAALGSDRPNGLFFAGDLGQRIFQQPFSWKSLDVNVRGRSRTLRVNYRTSHQIRSQADRLLARELTDVDGNAEVRSDTVSVFNGALPTVHSYADESEESEAVAQWLRERTTSAVQPHEIGLFVRSTEQLERAVRAVRHAGLPFKVLDEHVQTASGHVSISTMHLAKGLEFRAVAVMACDDEVIPLQARIEEVGDDADLQEVYDTERHLLYVACTRARDHLLVTGVQPGSEFLDDLLPS
jgi:mRNA-degrading endonuclease RelE of RelBE toxin-antitoxin system